MGDQNITNVGGNAQEFAAPAVNTAVESGIEGARGQEVAEPAQNGQPEENHAGVEPDTNAEPECGTGEEGTASAKPEQSPEQNAQFAAARRKAERERAMEVERIRAETEARENALIAGLGFTNPETGMPVRTRADYEAMQAATARQKEQQLARTAGMTDEEWKKLVDSSPTVQAAKESQRRAAEERQAARMEQVRAQMREDMAEISKLDGTIKTPDDLRAAECWPEMEGMMRRGYSMLDAYKLANYEQIAERRAQAAKQQALNSAAQKQHMQKTEQQGTGGIAVPASVRAMYKSLNPTASDAEIERHYAKYAKK